MKHFGKQLIVTSILFFGFGVMPAKADYIATQDFYVDADTTITIVTSGNLSANIDGFTGALGAPLSLNFNISTNENANDIRLRAMITDMNSTTHSAFYCTGSGVVSSQDMHVIMAEHDIEAPSILDCKLASSAVDNNPCAIAYPGTVTINNGGTIQYQENGGDGYFSAQIASGVTDLNMTLSTQAKPGTYDAYVANDCAEDYEVLVYLDNIPG